MRKCIAGEPVEVWGDASRKKELLYIDDFTEAIKRAVECDVCGIFNLPGDRPYTLDEQIQGLIEVFSPLGPNHAKVYKPEKPSTPQNLLDGRKAEELLGWKAKISWLDACRRMRIEMKENRFLSLWGEASAEDFI